MKDTNIAKVVALVELRRKFLEDLKRLNDMQGMTQGKQPEDHPKAHTIKFETNHGTHCHIHCADDPALNMKLVDVAIDHLEARLAEIDYTLALVEENIIGVQFKD